MAGTYIDGVNENAARFPRDWLDRALTLKFELGEIGGKTTGAF